MFNLLLVLAFAYDAAAQLPTNCGVPAIKPTLAGSKIVSNTEAIPHSWSWQVQMRYNRNLKCGASIISNGWVLTAAHCFIRTTISGFQLHAGRHTENRNTEPNEQVSAASQIITHEGFSIFTADNDVALVRLQTPYTFNDYVSPVCLTETEPAVGTDVWVTGWGLTKGTCCAGKLKQALLAVTDRPSCAEQWLSENNLRITKRMLCAGKPTGYPSACDGDSGGPLVTLAAGNDNKFNQVGIVSLGPEGCTGSTLPNVYANVAELKPWILSKISQVEAEEALVLHKSHFQPRKGAAFRALAKSLEIESN